MERGSVEGGRKKGYQMFLHRLCFLFLTFDARRQKEEVQKRKVGVTLLQNVEVLIFDFRGWQCRSGGAERERLVQNWPF